MIIRQGYGSNFNNLYIDKSTIIKSPKNDYGRKKINYEYSFYKYILDHDISFNMPKVLGWKDNILSLQFLSDYMPLYKVFSYNKSASGGLTDNPTDSSNKLPEEAPSGSAPPIYNTSASGGINYNILVSIYKELDKIHSHKLPVTRDIFFRDLKIELYTKVLERYQTIKQLIPSNIDTVNGVKIPPFENALIDLYTKIKKYYETYTQYEYTIIHGDCQFNNIMIKNGTTDDLVFIDPRGYYGETEIFGSRDYDLAKVLFAITGYDLFDNNYAAGGLSNNKHQEDFPLGPAPPIYSDLDFKIEDNSININIDNLSKDIIETSTKFQDVFPGSKELSAIIPYITICIWMGNAHCFRDNKAKMFTSYFYSMYLYSKTLM